MLKAFSILFVFLFVTPSLKAKGGSYNSTVKEKLHNELLLLQEDLKTLNSSAQSLKLDKFKIEQQLEDMRDWGVVQQQKQTEYYEQLVALNDRLAKSDAALASEKLEHKKTISRYHKVKNIMGVLAGTLLAIIYMRFGAAFLIPLTGPSAYIITLLGPPAVFAIGFGAIYLFL